MNSKAVMLSRLPKYKLFRATGHPKMLPMNLTFSVTFRCNSRCETCYVWAKIRKDFTVDEFDATLESLGDAPYWFTFSGGEPFLRHDIDDICIQAYERCRPGIINIPTNGYFTDRVPKKVENILEACPDTQLVVNLSLDGVGEKHNKIRRLPNNFDKAMKTYEALQSLEYENLNVGIHSVISRFNVHDFPELVDFVTELAPDHYITEIAEKRVELDTIGLQIAPEKEDYFRAVDYLLDRIENNGFRKGTISRFTQAFRKEYYKLVKRWLVEGGQVVPCFAGWASAHVDPTGEVWTCCIRAEPIGYLRDVDYDFSKVWFSEDADRLRTSIFNEECDCPLANAHYTSMLLNTPTVTKVALNSLRFAQ